MSLEEASSRGRRAEAEVSVLPQVAALASALTTLFNSLGITQAAYAVRINLDKSQVSRFLNGRRVATVDFIDQLFKQVERERPITDDVKTSIYLSRSQALRLIEPRQWELEDLQARTQRSEREIRRLNQVCEGLHLLVDQKVAEANAARSELVQLQGDWIAERVENEASGLLSRRHQSALEDTIAELRRRLAEAEHQRDLARARCEDLTQQLGDLEQRITLEREAGGPGARSLSVDALRLVLQDLWARDDTHEAVRELTEAAWALAVPELITLSDWLTQEERTHEATRLLVDACRARSVGDVAELILSVHARRPEDRKAEPDRRLGFELIAEIGEARSFTDIVSLMDLTWQRSAQVANRLIEAWVRSPRSAAEVVRMIEAAPQTLRPGRLMQSQARRSADELANLLSRLVAAGQDHCLNALVNRVHDQRYVEDGGYEPLIALSAGLLTQDHGDEALAALYRRFDLRELVELTRELARTSDVTSPRLQVFRRIVEDRGRDIDAYLLQARGPDGFQTWDESSWRNLVTWICAEGGPRMPTIAELRSSDAGELPLEY